MVRLSSKLETMRCAANSSRISSMKSPSTTCLTARVDENLGLRLIVAGGWQHVVNRRNRRDALCRRKGRRGRECIQGCVHATRRRTDEANA